MRYETHPTYLQHFNCARLDAICLSSGNLDGPAQVPSISEHCAGEPGTNLWSIMRTFTPDIANAFAHITPAGPAPTISTSTSVSLGAIGDDMVSRMGKPMRAEGWSGKPPAAQGASYTRTASDGWRSEHGPGCHPDVPIGHASRRRYPSEPAFRGLLLSKMVVRAPCEYRRSSLGCSK